MKYDEALKLWGAMKIAQNYRLSVEQVKIDTVTVIFEFDEGFECCNGFDPECYCSMATAPSAGVVIWADTDLHGSLKWVLDVSSFDFIEVLNELVTLGGGRIESDQ